MDEIAALTPTFRGVSYEKIDELGSIQWPCNEAAPEGTPTMHVDEFVRGKGSSSSRSTCRPTREVDAQVPAAADHRPHPVAVQRRRADAAHRQQPVAQRGPAGDPSARRRGARHQGRRLGRHPEPRRRDGAARDGHRAHAAGRGLHHLPLPGVGRQRDHHRQLRLGHQLPRVQGHGGAGHAGDAAVARGSRSTAASTKSQQGCLTAAQAEADDGCRQ